MLMNMNEKVTHCKRDIKKCEHEMSAFNMKVNETNMKLERESKIKDQVDALRQTIATLEKGMCLDIENAVKNHDEVVFIVGKLREKVHDISKERSSFMTMQDTIRRQIDDYQTFLDESRDIHDRQMIEFKSTVTQRLDENVREIKEMDIDRRQLKAMIKNQNFHYTELQKEMGLMKSRTNATEKICAEVPGLIEYTEVTDNYLQNYLPTEIYSEIHRALLSSF